MALTSFPRRRPLRSLLFLLLVILASFGFVIHPISTRFYPNVVINVADNHDHLQLNFLLRGAKDEDSCENAATTLTNAVISTCRECKLQKKSCNAKLSPDMQERFGKAPLDVPSATTPMGNVTYTSSNAGLALAACKNSEGQTATNARKDRVTCFAAGVERKGAIDQQQHEFSNINLLMGTGAVLFSIIVIAILMAIFTNRRRLANPAFNSLGLPILPSNPWLDKIALAGTDALILFSTFLALCVDDWNTANIADLLDRGMLVAQAIIIVATISWFWLLLEHYTRRRPFWDELREIFRVLAIMLMISGTVAFVTALDANRSKQLIILASTFVLVPFGRVAMKQMLDSLGLWRRPTLIIGAGDNAKEAYKAIKSEQGLGYEVIGFINACDKANSQIESVTIQNEVFRCFNLGNLSFKELHQELAQPQVVLAVDSLNDQKIVQQVLAMHINVHIVPEIRGLPLFGTQLSHFFSHEVLFLTVRNNLARRGYVLIKRVFDLVVASVILLLLAPVFAFLSYRIRLDGGKAFYGHTRVGKNNKPFKCLKFRSMRSDADKVLKQLLENDPVARAEWDKDFKLKNDPRITPVGHFLRKTSLDELPQLINVIKGEMSLVGPRPIVAAELERYGDASDLYLQVLPGMTGLWQVSGRNDTSYAERVSLDAWYVQNWSLWYDIAILFKTVGVVFQRDGAY